MSPTQMTLPEYMRAVADRVEAAVEKTEQVRLMKVLRETLDDKIKEHEKR